MQLLSQASKFDDCKDRLMPNPQKLEADPVVPTTWDVYYDPNHPDADWSGMVNTRHNHKKHIQGHASQQIGIVQTELGIISKEEKQEWARRKQPENATDKNKGSIVLGGDTSARDEANRFKTSYQSLAAQEATGRDQMILEKRAKPKKNMHDPAQSQPQTQISPRYNTQQNSYDSSKPFSASSLKKGFLSDIGASLVNQIPDNLSRNTPVAHVDNKVMITENYNPRPG